MSYPALEEEYKLRLPKYTRIVNNLQQAFEVFLKEQGIPYVAVNTRVKSYESFIEKIDRKKYTEPFEQTEDFCGIRIILYYKRDISAVQEIIGNEFEVESTEDKSAELGISEFGYRSNHSIVKIKKEWLLSPNYRKLEGVKIEIQVRTLLMHAWAEMEHKMVYKNKDSVAEEIKREIYLLSAKLEDADKHFQSIKNSIDSYQDDIKLSIEKGKGEIDVSLAINYESLKALLDYYLPNFPDRRHTTQTVFKRILDLGLSSGQLTDILKKIQPFVDKLNQEVFPDGKLKLTQGTILDYALDIYIGVDSQKIYSTGRIRVFKVMKEIICNS